jgi:hypothetical protein
MIKDAQETRIKRGHMTLMKHRDTALYSGVMLMGSSEVADNVPTAYTDGVNKKYGRKFLESIAEESKVRGLILHENLHVALKQVAYGRTMFNENRHLFVKPCAQNAFVFCGGIPRYTVSRSLMGSTTTSQSYSSHLAAVEHKQDV